MWNTTSYLHLAHAKEHSTWTLSRGRLSTQKQTYQRRLWWPPQLRCRFFQLAARIARRLEPSRGNIIHIWLPDSSPQLFGGNLNKKTRRFETSIGLAHSTSVEVHRLKSRQLVSATQKKKIAPEICPAPKRKRMEKEKDHLPTTNFSGDYIHF